MNNNQVQFGNWPQSMNDAPIFHAPPPPPLEIQNQEQIQDLNRNSVQSAVPSEKSEIPMVSFKNPYLGDVLKALYTEDKEVTQLGDHIDNLKNMDAEKDRLLAALQFQIATKQLSVDDLKKERDRSASEVQRITTNIRAVKERLGIPFEVPPCVVPGCTAQH